MMKTYIPKLCCQRILLGGSREASTEATETTFAENVRSNKKLEYYRNLTATQNVNTKPVGWDEALPFEKIPGPKPLPLIGNAWRFLIPKIGNYHNLNLLDIHKKFYEEYGNVVILKGLLGRAPVVQIFDPADFETLYRNEGAWPIRNGIPSYQYYRTVTRRDVFQDCGGLLSKQGEDWYKFRSIVNPILMQRKNVLQYVDQMNNVADELVDNIRHFSQQNENGEMPEDFHNELYKWSLESIGVITMDKHLGCLKRDVGQNSEPQKLIKSVLNMFDLMYKLDVLPSLWKIMSTRNWKEYVKILDFLTFSHLAHINQRLDDIKKEKTSEILEHNNSVLDKLMKVDNKTAISMTIDMMIAGVDTTGRVLASTLYYLAKNPDKQQNLREESLRLLENKDSPVTKETLSKVPYLRAVIKETTRLAPIAVGNLRTTIKDLVLGGYQIPKGTEVLTCNLLINRMENYYPKSEEFIPERWLSTAPDELSHKNTSPFIFAPFGHGPRSCIGKRFANLELETAILKIIRNFELDWPHEEMVFSTTFLHGIARPLKIHVKPFN